MKVGTPPYVCFLLAFSWRGAHPGLSLGEAAGQAQLLLPLQ